jgi:hypothetical protein
LIFVEEKPVQVRESHTQTIKTEGKIMSQGKNIRICKKEEPSKTLQGKKGAFRVGTQEEN